MGHEVLIQGNLDIEEIEELTGEPLMLTGKAGDAFLCHHLIQHMGRPQSVPHVRHAVISRVKHRKVDELDLGTSRTCGAHWKTLRV